MQWINLTGAPVLIRRHERRLGQRQRTLHRVGCIRYPSNGGVVRVNAYPGATHAWDRLIVPTMVNDPFADQGSYFQHRRTPGGAIYA